MEGGRVVTAEIFDPLTIAVRAYAFPFADDDEDQSEDKKQTPGKGGGQRNRNTPQRTIVFDTETSTDESQRLHFGSYRYYIDRLGTVPGQVCVEEGLIYADELPDRDPVAFQVLQSYVASHQAKVSPGRRGALRLLSRSEFVEQILYKYGYRNQATIVGFNLPFDLSRIALSSGTSRGFLSGGISLRFWEDERFRPRIAYRALDSRRTLMQFTRHDDPKKIRGHFLDLRTLAFALTDKAQSLEGACASFGVPYVKRDVTHGVITEEYVTYCREDVGATTDLFRATISEFRRHPIDLLPTKAYSPATIGKSYLRAMGIPPILERQPDFDPVILAAGMEAFYGGRAECRIRMTPLPVLYVDFLSMYPTVNGLMGNWDLIIAQRIEVDEVAEEIRELLAAPELPDQCFDPAYWPRLRCLVQLAPSGDILPVRAAYDPANPDFGIGINPYKLDGGAWYSLGDVMASVILGGPVPQVLRAVHLRPVGQQTGLNPVSLRGMVEVDPRYGDFFRTVIELRKRIAKDSNYSRAEREQLTLFLKVLANSAAYGILAEFVREESSTPVDVLVHTGDGMSFHTSTLTPERPGAFCFPPIAATITGGARLMLALLERQVIDAG